MDQRNQGKRRRLFGVEHFQVLFATIAIGLTLMSVNYLRDNVRELLADESKPTIDKLITEQARLKEKTEELHKQLEILAKTPTAVNTEAQIATLELTVQKLEGRFSRIERAILQDPAKSLELPMLRKDLEKSQEITIAQMAALRQDIERTYSLITGTMIALALAVLAPALSNLFSRARPTSRQGEQETPNPATPADA